MSCAMKTLVVIDMQNDFITGPLGSPEARGIVHRVQEKILDYRRKRCQVIFTLDTHGPDYLNTHEGMLLPVPHCIEGTNGHKLVDGLALPYDIKIQKNTFGFTGWDDIDVFGCASNIELVGVCTDICVVSNALILRALYPYVDISVDANCCAGTTPKAHYEALQVMKSCQIDVFSDDIDDLKRLY